MIRVTNIPCESCGYDPTRTILYEVEILVPFKWQSGNIIGPNTKSNWKYRAYRNGFAKVWKSYALQVLPAKNKRRLEITRVTGKYARPIDEDNLGTGAKPILDVLSDYNAIVDDSKKWLERRYAEEKSSDGKHYIRIKIIEYEQSGREITD